MLRSEVIAAACSTFATLAGGSRVAICRVKSGMLGRVELRVRFAGDSRPIRGFGSVNCPILYTGWKSGYSVRSGLGRMVDALIEGDPKYAARMAKNYIGVADSECSCGDTRGKGSDDAGCCRDCGGYAS